MTYDPITRFLDRFAWLAWFILVSSLMLGVGTELGSAAPAGRGIGIGELAMDVAMTVLCWCAALAMLATQLACSHVGNIWERSSRWLMLGAQSVFAVRFTTMLVVNADIYAPPVTIAAFSLLSIAQLMHCFGIFARAARYSDINWQADKPL
jgi:hypothetical protein